MGCFALTRTAIAMIGRYHWCIRTRSLHTPQPMATGRLPWSSQIAGSHIVLRSHQLEQFCGFTENLDVESLDRQASFCRFRQQANPFVEVNPFAKTSLPLPPTTDKNNKNKNTDFQLLSAIKSTVELEHTPYILQENLQ